MAKSKNGGSRSFIRGRIGSDVYSVGKDGKGLRQQVVRSLAVQVSNPRTQSQMFGRMIMSTVMQAVSGFSAIIDHSFDGIAKGQPSISEFIRRNYALVKADAIAHPDTSNVFGLNEYQQKGMKIGHYCLSDGNAAWPQGLQVPDGLDNLIVNVGATLTYGALRTAWGLDDDEYITLISFAREHEDGDPDVVRMLYARLRCKVAASDATVLTEQNALAAFDIEGNFTPAVRLSEGGLTITNGDDESVYFAKVWGIVTRKENGSYIHSALTIDHASPGHSAADDSLPTYPTGAEQFLNGGDL